MKFTKGIPDSEGWYWAIDASLSSRWVKAPFPVECVIQRGVVRVFEGREELPPHEAACLAFGEVIDAPATE